MLPAPNLAHLPVESFVVGWVVWYLREPQELMCFHQTWLKLLRFVCICLHKEQNKEKVHNYFINTESYLSQKAAF
jgi:hypothetical protein